MVARACPSAGASSRRAAGKALRGARHSPPHAVASLRHRAHGRGRRRRGRAAPACGSSSLATRARRSPSACTPLFGPFRNRRLVLRVHPNLVRGEERVRTPEGAETVCRDQGAPARRGIGGWRRTARTRSSLPRKGKLPLAVADPRGLPLLGRSKPPFCLSKVCSPRPCRASSAPQSTSGQPFSLGASAESSCRRHSRAWRPTPAGSRY